MTATRRACTFPAKDKQTKAEAKHRARLLNERKFDGARVVAYKCAGHWHVGHPPARRRPRRVQR